MKILNVREGFACNSSSTHSILFTKKHYATSDTDGGTDFGWQEFVASDRETKANWLAAQVRGFYFGVVGSEEARAIASSLMLRMTGIEVASEGSVDHQSIINLPLNWDGVGLNLEFLRDLVDCIMREDVTILGGNDNTDDFPFPHVEGDRTYVYDLPHDGTSHRDCDPYDIVAKKDPAGYWVLFDRKRGGKYRISFEGEGLLVDAHKAASPELVDLKITDFCPYGCPTCYMDSTLMGKHASMPRIRDILSALSGARVFEVAIGGGEPTLHPEFEKIVNFARHEGVVPNFTTKDPKWFRRFPDVLPLIGSFAVSADDTQALRKILAAIDEADRKTRDALQEKIVIQHILGLQTEYETNYLIKQCVENGLSLVLLGYKTTGRGNTFNPHTPKSGEPWSKWLVDRLETEFKNAYRIGIDTVLAAEIQKNGLDKGELSNRLTVREGQFSGYIDPTPEDGIYVKASSFGGGEGINVGDGFDEDKFLNAWKQISSYTPEGAYSYKKRLDLYGGDN